MFPFDSNSSRRTINLGGSASSSTHISLLSEARAIRQERDSVRRRSQAALTIQGWTRACHRRRAVQRDIVQALRLEIDEGRSNDLKALRLLGLVKPHDRVVGEWATSVQGGGMQLHRFGPTVVKHAMLVVLQAISKDPS